MPTMPLPLIPVLPSLNARVHVHRLLDELRTTPTPAHWEPAAEVREDATGYTLTLELPGVPPEGVELLADGGTLLVRGEGGPAPWPPVSGRCCRSGMPDHLRGGSACPSRPTCRT